MATISSHQAGNPSHRNGRSNRTEAIELLKALGQQPNGAERGAKLARAGHRADPEVSERRGRVATALATDQSEFEHLTVEVAKMRSALDGGSGYLPADNVSVFPSSWPGRIGFVVFSAVLVALEVSSAVNISALMLPIVQSVPASWCMVAPIAAVPGAIHCLSGGRLSGYRFWIGALALLGALIYGLHLGSFLDLPSGSGSLSLGSLLRFQLVAEILEIGALTMVLAKLTTPNPSEAVKHLLDAANRRLDVLAGEIGGHGEARIALEAAEEAEVEETMIVVFAAGAAREAAERYVRDLDQTSRGFFERLAGREN